MRRILPAGLLLGLMVSIVSVHSAAAQNSYRHGFWIGAGIGNARADLACRVCVDDTKGELSGYLRAGFTLKPSLLLGLEATRTQNSEDGVDEHYNGISAVVLFYPGRSGLYFKGGMGILDYKASDTSDEFTARTLAVSFGLGYEVRVARQFSVVPFVNLTGTTSGDLSFNGQRVTTDANFSLLQAGIGVTMH
jgi:hypothetical protein